MSTVLGDAIKAKRGERSLPVVGRELGVSHQTVLRLERGHEPSLSTAQALAKWLGWTLEQVAEAAEKRVEGG